jgi:hypothetical protein
MMRKWHGMVLIVLALLAVLGGQAGIAAAEDNASTAVDFKDIEGHWAKAVIQDMAG